MQSHHDIQCYQAPRVASLLEPVAMAVAVAVAETLPTGARPAKLEVGAKLLAMAMEATTARTPQVHLAVDMDAVMLALAASNHRLALEAAATAVV